MPRKTTATTRTSQATAGAAPDHFAALNGAAAETFVQSCEACAQGSATLNAEVVNFINTRMNRDMELGEAVTKCADWADVINLQQAWARQATQDYFAQTSKLVQLAAKLTDESWRPISDQTNQLLKELNKPLS